MRPPCEPRGLIGVLFLSPPRRTRIWRASDDVRPFHVEADLASDSRPVQPDGTGAAAYAPDSALGGRQSIRVGTSGGAYAGTAGAARAELSRIRALGRSTPLVVVGNDHSAQCLPQRRGSVPDTVLVLVGIPRFNENVAVLTKDLP